MVRLIVEIESRGGEMKMKMDVRVCDIKLKVRVILARSTGIGWLSETKSTLAAMNSKSCDFGLSNDTPSSVVQSDPKAQ